MNPPELAAYLKARVRTVRDWPKPRVNFRDVTTLLGDPEAFRAAVRALAVTARLLGAVRIAAVDARGFILGGALGEGVDMLGGRIRSAVIVGPALPEVNALQEARRRMFADDGVEADIGRGVGGEDAVGGGDGAGGQ